MGFAWVQDISIAASIDAVDITEIRTNVDTVDDEKCAADKTSYDNDDKDGDDAAHNPGYLNNDNGTYQGGYQSGYDSTDEGTVLNDDHGSYENNDESGARTPFPA